MAAAGVATGAEADAGAGAAGKECCGSAGGNGGKAVDSEGVSK